MWIGSFKTAPTEVSRTTRRPPAHYAKQKLSAASRVRRDAVFRKPHAAKVRPRHCGTGSSGWLIQCGASGGHARPTTTAPFRLSPSNGHLGAVPKPVDAPSDRLTKSQKTKFAFAAGLGLLVHVSMKSNPSQEKTLTRFVDVGQFGTGARRVRCVGYLPLRGQFYDELPRLYSRILTLRRVEFASHECGNSEAKTISRLKESAANI